MRLMAVELFVAYRLSRLSRYTTFNWQRTVGYGGTDEVSPTGYGVC